MPKKIFYINIRLVFLNTRRHVSCMVEFSKSFILLESDDDKTSSCMDGIRIRSLFLVKLEKESPDVD